jgi:hypothetical protein
MQIEQEVVMNIAIFGMVRLGRIKSAVTSAVERWIGDRRSSWERRLDGLDDLLAEPDENARG